MASRAAMVGITPMGLARISPSPRQASAQAAKPAGGADSNEFFKVGVSQAGNHDNRVYEDDWAEKWQGLLQKKPDDLSPASAEGTSGAAATWGPNASAG